jgi:hypothetical protein
LIFVFAGFLTGFAAGAGACIEGEGEGHDEPRR